jgi:hypothetical protein
MSGLSIDWASLAWAAKVSAIGLGAVGALYLIYRMLNFRERR